MKKIQISHVMALLVLSCTVVSIATSDPSLRPQSISMVVPSSNYQAPSIWYPVNNITSSDGYLDATCDDAGHVHILYKDGSDNLMHAEYNGTHVISSQYLGVVSSTAAICVVGTTVHVVYRSMSGHVQYTRRVGVGNVWELNVTLPGSDNSKYLDITASETQVYVLWREVSPMQIFLGIGSGTSWTYQVVVYPVYDDYNSGSILYKDGRLHFSWVNNHTIYYRCFVGATAVIDETVPGSSAAIYAEPSITASSTDIYISYVNLGTKNCSYVRRSFVNLSASWTAPVNFTRGNMYIGRMESNIAYVDGILYFTWRSYVTNPVWLARTHLITFNGTWSTMENVTETGSNHPRMATSFEGIVIAFASYPGNIAGFRYKYHSVAVKPSQDVQYIKGSSGNEIRWLIFGRSIALGNYQVFKDSVFYTAGTWMNGSKSWVVVDGLDIGTYNYTIQISDLTTVVAYDTVIVTVVDEPPADNSGIVAAIVIACAVGGGLLVVFLLDKKKIIDLKKLFGKTKR